MPFIGKSPQVGAFQLIDSITTSATDTYALTVSGSAYIPESARNLIVSLNGVTQAPESAYTVSGSNIVFASALTASDVIDYILVIGDAVDIGTPSDNTVGDAQLKAALDLSSKTLTFANDQISGDVINGGSISSFASTGIDDNATSTAITIDASENVGIGTASPAYLIDARTGSGNAQIGLTSGGDLAQLILTSTNTAGNSQINFADADSSNIGMLQYFHSDNHMRFTVNSTEAMRIDSSGNVSVDRGQKIQWYDGTIGSGNVNAAIEGTGDPALKLYTRQSGTSTLTERMRLDTLGNVIVGGTYFGQAGSCSIDQDGNITQVSASGVASSSLFSGISGVSNGFQIQTTAANKHIYSFLNGPNVAVKIDDSSRVGIGTTTLFNPLTVKLTPNTNSKTSGSAFDGGAIRLTSTSGLSGTNSEMAILAGAEDTLSAGIGFARQNGGDWGTQIRFYTHGTAITTTDELTERMRLDASGNLLVGTTSASGKITASNGGSGTGVYVLQNSSGTNFTPVLIHNDYITGGNTGTLISFERFDGVAVGSIRATTSTTSYNPSSDARLKENIRDYDNALVDVMKLKPRKYSWKSNGAEDSGFIAQELMETPEFANRVNPIDDDLDDPMYGVDYMKFVAVLTGAIQEQQAMIQELKAEVAALKGA
jgi:hypothetical protein